jgi:hypothetical protein
MIGISGAIAANMTTQNLWGIEDGEFQKTKNKQGGLTIDRKMNDRTV